MSDEQYVADYCRSCDRETNAVRGKGATYLAASNTVSEPDPWVCEWCGSDDLVEAVFDEEGIYLHERE